MPKPTVDDVRFARTWNDIESYPTIQAVADELGYTYDTVRSRTKRLRKRKENGVKDTPALIDRGVLTPSILPEMQYTFFEAMTEEDCIKKLRDLYLHDVSKSITRNGFRVATGISDSTWNRYFGTFLEFQRQAGVIMTRQQHKVERNLAKHTSADHYREFNDRRDYDGKYNKATGSKIQTILGCSDLHDIEIDPFYLRVLIEAGRILQPNIVNFGGDIFDMSEFGKYAVDPREWDPVGRIKFVHENIFAPMRETLPDAQFDMLEGNHEYRLLRHLADATPALKAILSDLLGITVAQLLGLDKFEINYIAKGDLAAFNQGDIKKEVAKSYKIYDETVLVHHHPHASQWGLPGWNGHHHSHKSATHKSALRGSYQWMQLGCGHKINASYAEAENSWNMGFNICHFNAETNTVNFEYIPVTDMACVGGVYFHRRPEEMVGMYAKFLNK